MDSLPEEVLSAILSHVTTTDLKNLSLLNHAYRDSLIPFVFRRVQCIWKQLFISDIEIAQYAEELRIIDFYSHGEWNIDLSRLLSERFPRINSLSINTNSSSGWLKYIASDSMRKLTLYHCAYHHETQSFINRHTAVVTIKRNHPRFFNINHILNLPNLTQLTLHEYTFYWDADETPLLANLRSLIVVDCKWEYPFLLTQFNPQNNLQNLELHYSRANPFMLSERFNMFFLDERKEVFQSLKSLTVSFYRHTSVTHISDCTWERSLGQRVLEKFVNKVNYPNLRKLRMHGWYVIPLGLSRLLDVISFDNLLLLDLQVLPNIGEINEEEVISQFKRKFPRTRFQLSVVEDHGIYVI